MILVCGLLLAIPSPVQRITSERATPPAIDQLLLSEDLAGVSIGTEANGSGMWPLVDSGGQTKGFVARTLPAASDAIGYRGPTEASILLTEDLKIASVAILSSTDTAEHVEAVRRDKQFFAQFKGWEWGNPPRSSQIDAVSGATLTSLALAEGVLLRIGDKRPSLVFPDPIATEEVTRWYPNAARVDENSGDVYDASGTVLGRVMRTGPLVDDIAGYQGPTELLLQLSPGNENAGNENTGDEISDVRIRRSFDNEPYVGYVRQERGFWRIFRGRTLSELAVFSPVDEEVEGVSGATMTSLTVADTLVAAAQAHKAKALEKPQESEAWSPRFSAADVGTIAVLIALALVSRRESFLKGWPRKCWLASVILVIGVWSGNLVSMALVAGWSAEGIAWRLAPALTAIAAVAFLVPPLTKQNPYCNHLCPHGAIQQWVAPKPTSKRRTRLPARMNRWLLRLPGMTLAVAYVAIVVIPSLDLSTWEPFHAYLIRVAGWGSIAFALVSLLIASRVPMAYCRLGCPTGYLIDYVRRTAKSHRIQRSDIVALGLLLFAISWQQLS